MAARPRFDLIAKAAIPREPHVALAMICAPFWVDDLNGATGLSVFSARHRRDTLPIAPGR